MDGLLNVKEIQFQVLAKRSLVVTNILRQAMSLLHAMCWFWFMSTQSAQLLRWVPLPPRTGIQWVFNHDNLRLDTEHIPPQTRTRNPTSLTKESSVFMILYYRTPKCEKVLFDSSGILLFLVYHMFQHITSFFPLVHILQFLIPFVIQ
jgi:hypothetical protein